MKGVIITLHSASSRWTPAMPAEPPGPGGDASLAALERAGERFMSMFDDEAPRPKKQGRVVSIETTTVSPLPSANKADGTSNSGKGTRKRQRLALETQDTAVDGVGQERTGGVSGPSKHDSRTAAAAKPRGPTVVVFSGDRPNHANSRMDRGTSKPSGNANVDSVTLKRAKRLFMSDSITRVHEVVRAVGADLKFAKPDMKGGSGGVVDGELPAGEVTGLTGASLNDMRKQVAVFGASGLDKWSRRSLEKKTSVAQGAIQVKGVRTPPTIGVGMWKKNEQREEAKRMEVFDAGGKLGKKTKGLRKADAGDDSNSRKETDRGLAWGSGSFKNGVLTISKVRRAFPKSATRRARTLVLSEGTVIPSACIRNTKHERLTLCLTYPKRDLAKETLSAGGATFLSGTKLSGADGKKRKGAKGGESKKGVGKGGRPQGGKKGKKR